WAWDDFDGYLGALERQGVGPNVAAFIGHSAVRYRVMGPAAVERAATAEERAAMAALVRAGMDAGALGWSTSLSPTHFFGDGTPTPAVAPASRARAAPSWRRSRRGGTGSCSASPPAPRPARGRIATSPRSRPGAARLRWTPSATSSSPTTSRASGGSS